MKYTELYKIVGKEEFILHECVHEEALRRYCLVYKFKNDYEFECSISSDRWGIDTKLKLNDLVFYRKGVLWTPEPNKSLIPLTYEDMLTAEEFIEYFNNKNIPADEYYFSDEDRIEENGFDEKIRNTLELMHYGCKDDYSAYENISYMGQDLQFRSVNGFWKVDLDV